MSHGVVTGRGRGHRLTVLTGVMLAGVLFFWGCDEKPESAFQGYVEGEFVLVAPPLAGRLEKLLVARGGQVAAGELLFVLDQVEEQAIVAAAEQEVQRAASQLNDLRKGQRPSELRAIAARVELAGRLSTYRNRNSPDARD